MQGRVWGHVGPASSGARAEGQVPHSARSAWCLGADVVVSLMLSFLRPLPPRPPASPFLSPFTLSWPVPATSFSFLGRPIGPLP